MEKDQLKKPPLKMVGEDGNAFAILGRASRVAKKNGLDWEKIRAEATSGDYDHLLQTIMKYFDCDGDSEKEDE
jgi:hypothetical protein